MNNPERIAPFLGIAILAAACADQSAATRVAPSAPIEKIDYPELSAEQMAKILWRMKDAKDVMNASVSKDFRPVILESGRSDDENEIPKLWARFYSHNSDPHRSLFFASAGPDGILRFRVVNTYDDQGRLLESTIASDIDTRGSIEYILQIGRYERSMKYDSPGRIPPEHLREVAYSIFNLPRNLEWEATISNYEGGTNVPTLKSKGRTLDGGKLDFSIDSFGKVDLTKTYPSRNLSFEQRFNPHKFAANGFLKPQYSPRELGL